MCALSCFRLFSGWSVAATRPWSLPLNSRSPPRELSCLYTLGDCLRGLCYVITRSQLTFLHIPFAPVCFCEWINTCTFLNSSSPKCDSEKYACRLARRLNGGCLGWFSILVLRWAGCLLGDRHLALKLSILDGRIATLQSPRPSIISRLWPTLGHTLVPQEQWTSRQEAPLHGGKVEAFLAPWADWKISPRFLRRRCLFRKSIEARNISYIWGNQPRIISFKDKDGSTRIIFQRTTLDSASDFWPVLRRKSPKKRRTGNKKFILMTVWKILILYSENRRRLLLFLLSYTNFFIIPIFGGRVYSVSCGLTFLG